MFRCANKGKAPVGGSVIYDQKPQISPKKVFPPADDTQLEKF